MKSVELAVVTNADFVLTLEERRDDETGGLVLKVKDRVTGQIRETSDTDIEALFRRSGIAYSAETAASLKAFDSLGGVSYPPPPAFRQNAEANERMAAAAEYYVDKLVSRDVPNTDRGHLACAWAVNFVAKAATGSEVGGGLSTVDMYEALLSGRGHLVDAATIAPGCIVISPTVGATHGHVGIVGSNGLIYSNSSARGVWSQNYSIATWQSHFEGEHLRTEYFALL